VRDGVEIIHRGRVVLIVLSGDAGNKRVIGLEGQGRCVLRLAFKTHRPSQVEIERAHTVSHRQTVLLNVTRDVRMKRV